jgi:tRNA 2-thiouridine synthesizing protein A
VTDGESANATENPELLRIGQVERIQMNIDREIDTRGLNCPLPILKAKKALSDMQSGQTLKVIATDPGSVRDFIAFAKQTGNELLEQTTAGNDFIHVIRRR